MEFIEFKNKTELIFERNGLAELLTLERIEKLFELTKIMLEVNEKMNLTAITDIDGIILKHYADSLTVSGYIPNGARVIDVGCGAGFPTLPLAIFREDLDITALDGTAKRIKYVDDTARALGLDNVTAISARAEEMGKDVKYRESFDVATARAVAALPILSELCLPFVKKNGCFVAMKASKGSEELDISAKAIELCGGKTETVKEFDLTSESEIERRIIISVRKKQNTPAKYPRHYSQITKKPL